MNVNIRNVITLAQKEFADQLQSQVYIAMLGIFSFIIIASAYEYGVIQGVFIGTMTTITPGILMGMSMISYNISMFVSLLGIVLSFDTLLKEEKSGSLNVLLTHPFYRDNIITGKMLGSMMSLLFALLITVLLSLGTLIIVVGEQVTALELTRIAVFFVITFLYGLIFLSLGLLVSVLVKDPSDSLIYNIVIWLVLTVAFSSVFVAIIMILGFSFEEDGAGLSLLTRLSYLSPFYHYQQLISGVFDMESLLSRTFIKYWINLAVLIVTPVVMFVASFIAFLRRDIKV